MTKNVTVTDEYGTYVGTTYPKRAKGLVKNGRALFVDDCTIRLSAKAEPSEHRSEVKQMNYIYFNPREWSFGQSGQAERCFINDFDNNLVEGMLLGGWNVNYAKASSKHYLLAQDTEYCFVFWLNGGENDKGSEVCQLQIIFSQNQNDCYIYKLNRNYIRPLLHSQGWELYSIPFRTPDMSALLADSIPKTAGAVVAVDTQFAFVAGAAPMAVKPAKEPDFYKDWKDEPDEFAEWRPQRHNIIFEDGWPAINMYGGDKYSTEALRRRKGSFEAAAKRGHGSGNTGAFPGRNSHFAGPAPDMWDDEMSERVAECADRIGDINERYQEIQGRCDEAKSRYDELLQNSLVTAEIKERATDFLAGRFSALTAELDGLCDLLTTANKEVEKVLNGPRKELTQGRIDALENLADSLEGRCDAMEDSSLESLEDFLDDLESESEEDEED